MTETSRAARRARAAARAAALPKWTKPFLAELAATSNVSAAARKAGVATTTVYATRRAHAEFNRKWQQALCEGYDLLEIELLARLRGGELKPASGAKRGARSYDNGTALRLLVAHRQSAARQRAIRDNADTEVILASINAKLERMRERRLAAAAAPAQAQEGGDGAV